VVLDRLILLREQLKQKKCERCGLPLGTDRKKCPHCSGLNDMELERFLEESGIKFEKEGALPNFLLFAAIIIILIFLFSQILK